MRIYREAPAGGGECIPPMKKGLGRIIARGQFHHMCGVPG